jgi:Protein of unknown function (DUF3306)
MPDNDETFLSRWSRRKRGLEPEAPLTAPAGDGSAAPAGTAVDGDALPASPTAQDAMLTEADFADVNFEALDFGSDYARFMGRNVPDAIRNRALRKLWVSDPVLANMDGLHDYFGDYTDAAVAVPVGQVLQTAYRYGQGFLSDEEAAVWDRLGKPEPVATPNDADCVAAEVVDAAPIGPEAEPTGVAEAADPDGSQLEAAAQPATEV